MNELRSLGAHYFESWAFDMDSSRTKRLRRVEITLSTQNPAQVGDKIVAGAGAFELFSFIVAPDDLRDLAGYLIAIADQSDELAKS